MTRKNRKQAKLVLFDIDGTILVGIGKHPDAAREAFKDVLHVDYDPSENHGLTDLYDIHAALDKKHLDHDPVLIDKVIKRMVEIFKTKDLTGTKLLPGVDDLLCALSKEKDVRIGLVTGNIEGIAFTKLKHLKIGHYFMKDGFSARGGFGDRSALRSDLIRIAISEFEKEEGIIPKNNVFIIGDTPHDIRGAREAGVKVIAVATGKSSREQLAQEKPDHLFDDLSNTREIIAIIKKDT